MRTDAPQGLTRCFDPGSPDQLNFKTDYQPIVDAAYLAHAFLRAPKALWEPPDSATKERIIAAFKSLRNRKPFNSNWLLFDSMSEAFWLRCPSCHWDYRQQTNFGWQRPRTGPQEKPG